MTSLRYAIHAQAWTPRWDGECLPLIDRAAKLGFDAIEVPVIELDRIDPGAIRRHAAAAGIGVIASTVCIQPIDPTADDGPTRRYTTDRLKRCVAAASEMGAAVLGGVTYSALGRRLPRRPTNEHWLRASDVLEEVARYARELGVVLGIEPVNRYESFLVNTVEQAKELIQMIGEPNVAAHLDTFHMNIEEPDFYAAARSAAQNLCLVHAAESHRGVLGIGRVPFDQLFRALGEGGYTGTVGIEAPCAALDAVTCTWRQLSPPGDGALVSSLRFLRSMEARHYRPPTSHGDHG